MWIFSQNKKIAINSNNVKMFSFNKVKCHKYVRNKQIYNSMYPDLYEIKADDMTIAEYKDKFSATQAYEELMSHISSGKENNSCFCFKGDIDYE